MQRLHVHPLLAPAPAQPPLLLLLPELSSPAIPSPAEDFAVDDATAATASAATAAGDAEASFMALWSLKDVSHRGELGASMSRFSSSGLPAFKRA